MKKMIDIIRPYDDYTFDEILDVYNKTKNKSLIDYCKFKRNNIQIPSIMKLYNMKYEESFIFLFNIQRILDNKPIANDYEEMYLMINNIVKSDDDDEYDF